MSVFWLDFMLGCCAAALGVVAGIGLGIYIEGRQSEKLRRGLEATIRTLENQVSRMADELSRYEGALHRIEHTATCSRASGCPVCYPTPLSGSESEPQA
jgi:hypothetical protein